MGGRAVGGIGAGCAGFSVLGILISVGIVLWLASQGLDQASDAIDRSPASTTAPGPDVTATLTLTPSADLAVGAPVAVTVLGVPPGPIELVACTIPTTGAEPPAPLPGPERCSLPLATGEADASGTAVVEIAVPPSVVVADRSLPASACGGDDATCVVGVRPIDGDVLAVGILRVTS
jgi:hypothetical protein